MVQHYPPSKLFLMLILFGLNNLVIAQGGFFMPFDINEIVTTKVEYGERATYHNIKVQSINTETTGEITLLFQDEYRYDPNFSASSPLVGAWFSTLHFRRCIIFPDFMTVLGRYVKVYSDSSWVFSLHDGKTFTIHTGVNVGNEWEVYPLLNGSKIIGTMASVEPGTDTDEWIKTIVLSVEENPNLPSGKFDFYPIIRISTKKGILEMPRLSGFGRSGDGITHNARPLKFQHKSDNNVPGNYWERFRFENIWNLKTGDIIVSEKKVNLDKSHEHLEVMDTEWAVDSSFVKFKWDLKTYKIVDSIHSELSSSRLIDTTILKNSFWSRLDTLLPFTRFTIYPFIDVIFGRSNLNFYNGRQYYHLQHEGVWNESAQCFEYFNLDASQSIREFVDGLGGPYRYFTGFNANGYFRFAHYVIYYKKGNEEWGDPSVLTSIQNTSASTKGLRIFPTLVSSGSEVFVSDIPQNARISVLNVQGVFMSFHERKSENGSIIQLTDFKPGMYIVSVYSPEGEYLSGKFLVL